MTPLFSRAELDDAVGIVRGFMPETPTIAWPLLATRTGARVVVKHENHTPAGAFKVRGGAVYMDGLIRREGRPPGVVTATRGNHGQSIARAATARGIPCAICVPHGNAAEKNAAMKGFGAELHVGGADFDEARQHAARIAAERRWHLLPSFHADLVRGVATYALELFTAAPDLDAVYVPIGLGSGICGLITVRDMLGLPTEIIGVVADNAPAYALSVAAGHVVPTNSARTFADGMATRVPDAAALAIIRAGCARVLRLTEDAIADSVRAYFTDTHNLAEGAGAAPLAGLLQERERMAGKRVGLILCGGNIDAPVMAEVLAGRTPSA